MLSAAEVIRYHLILRGGMNFENIDFYKGQTGMILRIFEYAKNENSEAMNELGFNLLNECITNFRLKGGKKVLTNYLSVALLISEGYRRKYFEARLEEECSLFDKLIFSKLHQKAICQPAKINHQSCLYFHYCYSRHLAATDDNEKYHFQQFIIAFLESFLKHDLFDRNNAAYGNIFYAALCSLADKTADHFFKTITIRAKELARNFFESVESGSQFLTDRIQLPEAPHNILNDNLINSGVFCSAINYLFPLALAYDFPFAQYLREEDLMKAFYDFEFVDRIGLIDGMSGLSLIRI